MENSEKNSPEYKELQETRKSYIKGLLLKILGIITIGSGFVAYIFLDYLFEGVSNYNHMKYDLIEVGTWLLLIIIGSIIFMKSGKNGEDAQRDFKYQYKYFFVMKTIKKNFPNSEYKVFGGIKKEDVEKFGIDNDYDIFTAEDHLKAEYKGIPFEQSDILLQQMYKDNGQTVYTTYFKGTLVTFPYPDKSTTSLQLYNKRFLHREKGLFPYGKYKFDTENVAFNKNYDTFAFDQQVVFYVLTPQLMERLLTLIPRFNQLSIHICEGTAYVAFNRFYHDTFDADGILGRISIQKERQKIQQDIDDVKAIIDAIRGV